MTMLDIYEQAAQLEDEERKELVKLLVDTLVEKKSKDQHKIMELEAMSLGGLRPGVQLISRDEIYADEDEYGR
jgi:hypothetical protein